MIFWLIAIITKFSSTCYIGCRYCLLLNNVYRIGDVFFRSGNCPKTWSHFAYASQTSLLYVTIGEIVASKILFASNKGSLLKFVCFLRLKRAWRASYFNLLSVNEKLSVGEIWVFPNKCYFEQFQQAHFPYEN